MSSNEMIANHLALMTITDAAKPEIQFGEWQLCPKCNGSGTIPIILEKPCDIICNVCNGAKILARPIIK